MRRQEVKNNFKTIQRRKDHGEGTKHQERSEERTCQEHEGKKGGQEEQEGRKKGADVINSMNGQQPNDPLHGVTLEMILVRLLEKYGWEKMGRKIKIKCFTSEPSIKSSLVFLRKTPWARKKVEDWYARNFVKDWKEEQE